MRFTLPIALSEVTLWGQHLSPKTHIGDLANAIDFWCEEGTALYAAAPGVVVWLKQDSNVGGPRRCYYNAGNRIVLKHRGGYYTAYEHLRYQGANVELGQRVRRGQVIGWSGNTGISSRPHLHFELFVNPSGDRSEGRTVPVRFGRDMRPRVVRRVVRTSP